MPRLITAATQIPCPLCRRQLQFARDRYRQSWRFFCAFCRASAELTQGEIDRTARDGGFAELLRLRLVAALGRAARLEPPVGDEGPALKLRDDQPKLPTGRVKKRPTQQPRRRRPAPVALPVPPASSKTRRLQRARKALNDAMTEVATDKDDA